MDEDLDRLVLQISADVRAGLAGTATRCSRRCLAPSGPATSSPRLGDELEQVRKRPTILAGAPIAKLVACCRQVEDCEPL